MLKKILRSLTHTPLRREEKAFLKKALVILERMDEIDFEARSKTSQTLGGIGEQLALLSGRAGKDCFPFLISELPTLFYAKRVEGFFSSENESEITKAQFQKVLEYVSLYGIPPANIVGSRLINLCVNETTRR